jgi:hypothetical protein
MECEEMREKVNKFVSDWNEKTDNYRQTRLKNVDMTNENDLVARMMELFQKRTSDDNETETKTPALSSQSQSQSQSMPPNTDDVEKIEQSI